MLLNAPTTETKKAEGPGYDPARLRRASVRDCVQLGQNQFRVEGRHEKYYDVNLDLDTPCDCKDAEMHGRGCLHELRARLQRGDQTLLLGLGMMLLKAEQHLAYHTRRSRRKEA
jgi:hypothetical protein